MFFGRRSVGREPEPGSARCAKAAVSARVGARALGPRGCFGLVAGPVLAGGGAARATSPSTAKMKSGKSTAPSLSRPRTAVRAASAMCSAPSLLLGMYLALREARTNPGLALCALPLLNMMIVAAIWFGEVRLRTPYDPLALLLAAVAYAHLVSRIRRRQPAP